ncbi:trypsin-like peptidase domain-containing protein [Candidatus Woesebacteria bacterium]|nr:trypsin-like peptidase domain-containing protein [Candidatus Woesebacteria bacterium]QQG47303.1 MAG: trypsin-like peptidase domain-containing protein [Candidatus Woesebacteria bacterium]
MRKINLSSLLFKKLLIIVPVLVILFVAVTGGAIADRVFGFKPLDRLFPRASQPNTVNQKIVREESVVTDVFDNVSPSVVTVSIEVPQRRILNFDMFNGFKQGTVGGKPQDIGTGFILSSDGLIVTNKHVVSDTTGTYKVVTKDNKEYKVDKISRDPSNDIAILKINATGLTPVKLGNSSNLKVGQFVIAIGTALGEFRNTVTTGVVSGLGRGIDAGSDFQGYVERLDNVIQTDAAINPGNSGGPLINSTGEVIGINVAVAQGAQNIGFAIPIDVVRLALDQFKQNGKFASKAFLGVSYQMVNLSTAISNDIPQGAYVKDVVAGSPAEKAGIQVDDIITKIDGVDVRDDNGGLTAIIAKKKVGDKIKVDIWRNGNTSTIEVDLGDAGQ